MAPEENPTGSAPSDKNEANGVMGSGTTPAESHVQSEAVESVVQDVPPGSAAAAESSGSSGDSTTGSTSGQSASHATTAPACSVQECFMKAATEGFELAKQVISNPVGIWKEVKEKPWTVSDIYKKYYMPLLAIPIVATYIGLNILGPLPVVSGFFKSIAMYAIQLVTFYIYALVVKALATQFGGNATLENCLKLLFVSGLPVMFASAVMIIPVPLLVFIPLLAGLAGVYAFYQGIPEMTGTDPSKRLQIFVTLIVVVLFMCMALQAIF